MKTLTLRQNVLLAGSLIAGFTGSLLTSQAFAQEELIVEEIIVTSQRRQESVQEVPIAINAFSDTAIQNAGIDDLKELTQLAPALQASSTNSETQGTVLRIRGVGTQGNNPAFESAVGVFVDGVYRSRPGAALAELLDVERVEVMRGPQGTLFGRNTSAGAIHLITAKPKFEPGGYAEASFGNFSAYDVRGSVWGGLSDTFAVRLSGLVAGRDGLLDDTISGTDINTRERYTVKGQALFVPNEDVELRVIADFRNSDEDCCYAVHFAERPPGASIPVLITNAIVPGGQTTPPNPFARQTQVTSGRPLQHDVEDFGISAELTWDIGDVELTSITAFRDFQSDRHQDIDFTAADYLDNFRTDTIENFTQEFRLAGENGRLNWIVGAFYADETIELDATLIHGAHYEAFINTRLGPLVAAFFGPAIGATNYTELANIVSGGAVAPGTGWANGTGAIGDHFESDNSSLAFFTHNVFELTNRLDLILGLRWTDEEKHGTSSLNNDPANTPGCSAILPALAGLPNLTLQDIGAGDQRRVKDVLSSLGCLGITSPAFEFDLEQNDDEVSGIIGLSFQASDNVMWYGSYSRGFKAGGVNLDRAGTILTLTGDNMNLEALISGDPNRDNFLDPRFKPEIVDAYELGFKSELFDGRAVLNGAVFYEDFENFQLNTFTGFSFIPESVESVEATGVELDLQARLTEELDVTLGYAYVQAEYGNGLTDVSNKLANDRGFRTGTSLLPEISGLSGRTLTNAPETVWTGSLTWNRPINSNMEFLFNATARWQDDINTGSDLDPEKNQESFALVNARIGIGHPEGTWAVEAWSNNLFDEDFHQIAFDIPLQSDAGYGAFLGEQRTYGLTLRYNF
ncbi:MAG: TonB-dependent receptor [Woeseiaceae bacterium]|nr:TonB-dependent receptor [Woeseiaceae bacterium]